METPATLLRLAQILKMRKEANLRPYNLLLTSTLSLNSVMLQLICQSDSWSVFRQYIQGLGSHDRLHILAPLLRTPQHARGYFALARLITKGYFSTILTTNVDTQLEDILINTLREEELQRQPVRILVLGRDTDQYIMQALDDYYRADDIRIVKLHGDLRAGIIPAAFPDVFELNQNIRTSIQRYLKQDIIIVGPISHDNDVNLALTLSGQNSIYYVHSHMTETDSVVKLIEERGGLPETCVITGHFGHFDVFFPTLETLLLSLPTNLIKENNTELPSAEESQALHMVFPPTQLSDTMRANPPQADVLIVTVTDIETNAIFEVLQLTYERCFIGDKTYYKLGIINGARVFLVQSEMGTSGPGGSLLTISTGLHALSPSAVIMVGVAFGFDQSKQRIGDVLVSLQLRAYEAQRYGSRSDGSPFLIPRGDLVPASVRLIDRFRSGCKDWRGRARVIFGLVLSGEKLIDNENFRDSLRIFEPEAIGGEMEGVGLYAVAQRYKIDWILVKAICDWADGNKSQNKLRNQKKAARNAAMLTIHVLQQTKFC